MKTLRSSLTYSNVVSTICLFLLLGGGAAFAASELAKNSVGTEQIRKGAVTPSKLSATAKRVTLGLPGQEGAIGPRGKAGPAGPQGKEGPVGPPGKEGPTGTAPGAISFEAKTTATYTVVRTLNGVKLEGLCDPSDVSIRLEAGNGTTNTLDVFGTSNHFEATSEEVIPIDTRNASGWAVHGVSGPHQVDVDVITRNSAVSKAFGRLDLHLDADSCILRGMYISSTVG